MTANPFSEPLLRDWLVAALMPRTQAGDVVPESELWASGQYTDLPEKVGTTGSGPFEKKDYDAFLSQHLVEPHEWAPQLAVVVVGRQEWQENDLEKLLEWREGHELKVYSQEMFLSYLLSNVDPFSADRDVLRAFGEGHPALEFLSGIGFAWPSALVSAGQGQSLDLERPKVGFLRHLGYRVGLSGRPRRIRRRILIKVFEGVVPTLFPDTYRAEWGRPTSCKRLRKMANSIASLCRNARARSTPPVAAIADWEEDLRWLRQRLYSGRCRFRWPSTAVD